MESREQLSSGFSLEADSVQDASSPEERRTSVIHGQDNLPLGISLALRSVALIQTLDLETMFGLLFGSKIEEDSCTWSPADDQDESKEGTEDTAEDEVYGVSFQSKYIHFFPLYQDYCLQAVSEEPHRLNECFLSEPLTSTCLQPLRTPRCHSDTTSPQLNHPEEPSSSTPHPIPEVTQGSCWQDLDEVKASGLLSSMTTREIRLQESMFELIGSEASYLRSLRVAVNHFYASTILKQTLSQMEHHCLFSNIHRVMAANEKFLMNLETRLGECVLISQVGDIVLQHCPEFRRLYVPYVTNMMYQEALVAQLLHRNGDFLSLVKKLESDPMCQRQGLKSFLVLPFQRITRMKLILENILKLTDPGSDSTLNLEKAIKAIREILTECDDGVRKMRHIEELVCLAPLIDFGKVKAVPLIVGGRFLVHQGPVRQLIVETTYNSKGSLIDLYLHLFNDLLIISTKRDERFTVVEHAMFPTHVRVEHLKTEVMGLPPDSFLLHLTQSQSGHPTAMILVAHTRSDKEVWMNVLSRTVIEIYYS